VPAPKAQVGEALAAPQLLPRPEQCDAAGDGRPADVKAQVGDAPAAPQLLSRPEQCDAAGDGRPADVKELAAVGEAPVLLPPPSAGATAAEVPTPCAGDHSALQQAIQVSQPSDATGEDLKMDAASAHSDAESEPDDARLGELLSGAWAAQARRAAEADAALQDAEIVDEGSTVSVELAGCPAAPPRQLPCSPPLTLSVEPALEGAAEPQKAGALAHGAAVAPPATVEGRAPASPVVALQTKGRKRLADEMMLSEFPDAPLEPTALLEILQDVLPPR